MVWWPVKMSWRCNEEMEAGIARREVLLPHVNLADWSKFCQKYSLKATKISADDFKLDCLPTGWKVTKCEKDVRKTHWLDDNGRVVMTTFVKHLGYANNWTIIGSEAECDVCFPRQLPRGRLHVVDIPKRRPTPYWLFARVHNLEVGSREAGAAWARADKRTREFFTEKAKSVKDTKVTRRLYIHMPPDDVAIDMPLDDEEEKTRTHKIADRYKSDKVLGMLKPSSFHGFDSDDDETIRDDSGDFADYYVDIVDNEAHY
jgi:hypothetical protein